MLGAGLLQCLRARAQDKSMCLFVEAAEGAFKYTTRGIYANQYIYRLSRFWMQMSAARVFTLARQGTARALIAPIAGQRL